MITLAKIRSRSFSATPRTESSKQNSDNKDSHRRARSVMFPSSSSSTPPPLLDPSPRLSLPATLKHPSSSGQLPLRSAMKQPNSAHNNNGSRPITPLPNSPRPISPRPLPGSNLEGSDESTRGNGLLSAPAGYTHKVSFDTFENPNDGGMFSYTLQVCLNFCYPNPV